MKLALCTMLLNERDYLEEWLAWHSIQGVSQFLLWHDVSRPDVPSDGTVDLLQRLARAYDLTVVPCPFTGPRRQVDAFEAGLRNLRHVDWVAFIDTDEFLHHDAGSIAEWVAGFGPDVHALAVQQLVFGSAGRLDRPRELVTSAYRLRATKQYAEHAWFKSIVRPERVGRFLNSHQADVPQERYRLGDGAPFEVDQSGRATRIPERGAKLAHYMVKSRAEWLAKKARGALSDGAAPGFLRFTDGYTARDANCNLVSDDTWALYGPAILQRIAQTHTDYTTNPVNAA